MRVRRLDNNHDWTFGQGFNNYAKESEAIAQCVKTRLWSFKGDWFLDLEHGLPYLETTGRQADLARLEMLIKREVLSVEGVERITAYSAELDNETRHLTINVSYLDIYGNEHTTGGINGNANR